MTFKGDDLLGRAFYSWRKCDSYYHIQPLLCTYETRSITKVLSKREGLSEPKMKVLHAEKNRDCQPMSKVANYPTVIQHYSIPIDFISRFQREGMTW